MWPRSVISPRRSRDADTTSNPNSSIPYVSTLNLLCNRCWDADFIDHCTIIHSDQTTSTGTVDGFSAHQGCVKPKTPGPLFSLPRFRLGTDLGGQGQWIPRRSGHPVGVGRTRVFVQVQCCCGSNITVGRNFGSKRFTQQHTFYRKKKQSSVSLFS